MESKCPKCGVVHFPIALYKKWIKKYEGQAHFPKAKEQVARWQKLVDEHTTK